MKMQDIAMLIKAEQIRLGIELEKEYGVTEFSFTVGNRFEYFTFQMQGKDAAGVFCCANSNYFDACLADLKRQLMPKSDAKVLAIEKARKALAEAEAL